MAQNYPRRIDLIPFDVDEPVWHRLRDEPEEMYERFIIYRDMGATRSILKTRERYAAAQRDEGALTSKVTGSSWTVIAGQYRWKDRVDAMRDFNFTESGDVVMERTTQARDSRHLLRGTMEEKISNMIESIDPSAQPVDPIQLMNLAIKWLNESREEYEKPLQKSRDQAIAAQGQLTIAELIRLSRGSDRGKVQLDTPQETADNLEINLEQIIDADFENIT